MTEAEAFNTRRLIQLAYLTLEVEWWKLCIEDYFIPGGRAVLSMCCCLEKVARHRGLEEPV